MKIYKIALRNIFRNKRRSLLSGTAIAIAGTVIVFLFAFMEGTLADMKQNMWTYMTGAVRVRHADFDKYERLNPMHLSVTDYDILTELIEQDPAVTAVSSRINFPGRVPVGGMASDKKVNVLGLAVNFSREAAYQDYERTLTEGRLPRAGEREALIGRALSEKLEAGIGDKFTVLSQSGSRGSNAYTFTVTGILSLPVTAMEKTMVQIPLDTAQRFLWLPGQVQEILIKVDENIDTSKVAAERLSARLTADVPLSVKSYKEVNGMASMIDLSVRINDIIGIIFLLLASTVIINTTIMVIFERTKEIGTLGAMGMNRSQLIRLFFLEALFISLAGALAGISAGIGISAYYGRVGFDALAESMEEVSGAGLGAIIYPVLNFKSTVMVFVYSVIVSAAATWFPSRRAARLSPAEALRQ